MNVRLLIIMLSLVLGAGVTGCGDDGEQSQSIANRPKKKKKKKKKKGQKARKATAASAEDLQRVPPRFKEISWEEQAKITFDDVEIRDPFHPFVDDLRVEALEEKEQKITELATAIDGAEVGEIKLTTLLTGTAPHKAMVKDGRGMGHVLVVGDIVGRRPPMRVVRITRNELILRPLEKLAGDTASADIVLELRTQEELREQLQ